MSFRRVGIGIGVLSFGMAMAAVPVVPGVASAHPAFCSLNKNATKVETKTETSIVKALESGNWPAAQKALLTSFGQETSAEKAAIAALWGRPPA